MTLPPTNPAVCKVGINHIVSVARLLVRHGARWLRLNWRLVVFVVASAVLRRRGVEKGIIIVLIFDARFVLVLAGAVVRRRPARLLRQLLQHFRVVLQHFRAALQLLFNLLQTEIVVVQGEKALPHRRELQECG